MNAVTNGEARDGKNARSDRPPRRIDFFGSFLGQAKKEQVKIGSGLQKRKLPTAAKNVAKNNEYQQNKNVDKIEKHKHTHIKNKMKKLLTLLTLSCTLCLLSFAGKHKAKTPKADDGAAPMTLAVQPLAGNLQAPTAIAFPGNGEVWITEQPGRIRVLKNGKLADAPLLDLHSKLVPMNNSYEERGLLGIALHPKFATNRKFYVFYSIPATGNANHTDVIAEFKLPATGPVDPNSGRIILTQDKPDGNHNGGCIQFGPDGYLYISFGDGGGQGDKHGEFGNGQKMDTWLGKILRVDVNSTTNSYTVPKDNPFVGKPNAKPELWAYGFRNPYRFTFDKATGQLFAGDVGQDTWEEVDIVTKGANYGWRLMEGTHCYNPSTGCPEKGITMPITEYSHQIGISVIGGYVYNGQQLPTLKSKYLFADWTGKVFYLQKAGSAWQRGIVTLQNLPAGLKITGFGEDPQGELYILTNADTGPGNTKCSVYKVVKG